MVRSVCAGLPPGSMISVSRMRLGAGCGEPLTLSSPSEVFLLCVLQHLRQLRIAAVVGQDEDHLRIRLGISVRDRVVCHHALAPMRPRLQPEDLRRNIAALSGTKQRPEIVALASATPRSSSSRKRLRSVFGAQARAAAMVRRLGSGACPDTRPFNKHCATTTSTRSVSLDFMFLTKLNPVEPPGT
jgi:hypothetical protein